MIKQDQKCDSASPNTALVAETMGALYYHPIYKVTVSLSAHGNMHRLMEEYKPVQTESGNQ